MDVVDSHTHLFAPAQVATRAAIAERDRTFGEMYASEAAAMATASDLLAAMDSATVARAVVAGFAFTDERDIREQNEYVTAAARESGGRLIALATVNPALAGWEREARWALEAGARGFGELRPGSQGWLPCGPGGVALCELAREAGAVLLWHASEPVGHEYPGKAGGVGPAELIEIATAYPDVAMIGAHLGGGAAYYLQMPELREAIKLLYFDISAFSLLYDHRAVGRLVELAGVERVLFASDYPLQTPRRQLERVRDLLPTDILEAVLGGNAARLFVTETDETNE